jgi:hypothetical protein
MLTGKDVYLTEKVALGLRSDWEQLSSFIQGQYETQAALINETHIAPLQGLVRDQQELLTSWKGVLQNQYGPVQMQEALTTFDELVQRALVLLGEEPPSPPVLVTCNHLLGWRAYLESNPRQWEAGSTESEAIGKFLISHPDGHYTLKREEPPQ